MHLPYLRELRDRFEVRAVCDLSETALGAARDLFPEAAPFRDWTELVAERLDAVLVLTPGSHAPIAVAAAGAGTHIFVEKPMCFSVAEGRGMIDAAERAGVRLMVGYMKRYDPAFERLAETLVREDVRLACVTTLESPLEPYVRHHPVRRSDDVSATVVSELLDDDERRVTAAIAIDNPVLRRAYRVIVLDSMIHELNAVRALLGEPTELRFADVWGDPTGVTATLAFGATECVFTWVDLPGIARYQGELAFYGANERATLRFPSPFLRSMPTELVREGGTPGTPSAWTSVETVSYEEAFKRELVELHVAVTEGRDPRTSGRDAIRDIALAEALIHAAADGNPIQAPTSYEEHESRALH
jgi:predicted dehydrogenase